MKRIQQEQKKQKISKEKKQYIKKITERLEDDINTEHNRYIKKYAKFISVFLNNDKAKQLHETMWDKKIFKKCAHTDHVDGLQYETISQKQVNKLVKMLGPNLDY